MKRGHDKKSTQLVMPPSMSPSLVKRESRSTETTSMKAKLSKDVKLVTPPWRRGSFRIHMAESRDSSTVESSSRDRYHVRLNEIEERREQEDVVDDGILANASATDDAADDDTYEDHSKNFGSSLLRVRTVDSLSLISIPSARKATKKIFSRIKERVPFGSSARADLNQETVELEVLNWKEDKLTLQIIDGKRKTKVHLQLEKDNEDLPEEKRHTESPKEKTVALADNEGQHSVEQSKALFSTEQDEESKKKGALQALFPDTTKTGNAAQENVNADDHDNESLSTVGPDDIPHEVSYLSRPSITSYVFNEIPPAVSLPCVSDVSSNSSDASSWSSSSLKSLPPVHHGRMIVTSKKNWNLRALPMMVKYWTRPVVRVSNPLKHAFKNNKHQQNDVPFY